MKRIKSYICLTIGILLGLCLVVNAAAAQVSTLRGDVNGDGVVNTQDVVYLLRHVLMPEKYPLNQSGDMDVNEQTNLEDVVYLLRHTLKPETYPLECLEHQPQALPAKAPTCTQTGMTQGEHCQTCGKILKEQEVIPVRNHRYEDEWTCHARPCSYADCEHVAPATQAHAFTEWFSVDAGGCVSVSYQVRACMNCNETENTIAGGEPIVHGHSYVFLQQTNPTCTEPGCYVLSCKNCDLEHRQEFPATGHNLGEYIIDAEGHYKKCLNRNCSYRANQGAHSYDHACDTDCNICGYLRVTYHDWEHTYRSDAHTHWNACSVCGEKKNESAHSGGTATCQQLAKCETCQQPYGEFADHSYTQQNATNTYLKTPATCTDAAVYYFSCECGAKGSLTFSYGDALGHDWEEDYTTSGQKHWIECTACDAIKDEADHSGGTATCQTYAKCETCQQPYGEYADHSYTQQNVTGNYLKTPATCTDAAVYYYSCACGEKGSQTFSYGDALGHDWDENYTTDAQKHWIECAACDAIKDEASHSGGTATCQTYAKCETCQQPYGEYADHSYTQQNVTGNYLKTPATCTDAAVYYYSCACGEKGSQTFSYGDALGHDWDENYTTDAQKHWIECVACDTIKEEADHSGGIATCQERAKCEICLLSYGEFADHSYTKKNVKSNYLKTPATCTDAAVYYFSCECGAKGSQTYSYGDALGHDWEEDYTTSGQKHWIECTACDAIKDEANHSGGTATCQKKAKCEICQLSYGDFADHSYTQQNAIGTYLKDNADCTNAAVYYYSCACGEKGSQTFSYGDALGHDWNEEYSTDAQKHWIECAACDVIKDEASHSGGTATCQEQAECEICLLSYGELADHNYTQQNVTGNYRKTPATCTDAAVYYYSCACGEKGSQTFSYGDALGHDWNEEYSTDAQKHWIECAACDAIKDEEDHSGGTATCQTYAKCATCGQNYGQLAEHDYSQERTEQQYLLASADCTNAAIYYYSCICGEKGSQTFSYGTLLGHDWAEEYSTDVDNHWIKCSRCTAIKDKSAHSFGAYSQTAAPTCYQEGQEQRSCDTCGLTQSRAIPMTEHVLGNTDVITEGPLESEISGEVIYRHVISKPCVNYARCGYYEAVGEVTEHAHQAVTFLPGTDPTCTKTGAAPGAICAVEGCKEVLVAQQSIPALGHSFQDGICTRCGVGEHSLGMEYTLSADGSYYILTGMGTCKDSHVKIPEIYEGLPVQEIGEGALTNAGSVITISKNISTIHKNAFGSIINLFAIWVDEENVHFCSDENGVLYSKEKDVLIKVPQYASFSQIPESVTHIGNYAFSRMSFSSITIPSGVVSIGDYAFYQCYNLEEVAILGDLTCIGDYAFYYCQQLKAIDLPDSLISIGGYAFNNCSALTAIALPNVLESIGERAFAQSGLEEITIPGSVTTMGSYAFQNCGSMTAAVIEQGVTTVGNGAFETCRSLVTVEFPGSVTTIEQFAFSYTGLKEIRIPDSVTDIGWGAFQGCAALTEVSLVNGVTNIQMQAFDSCASLVSITIPESVTSIGYNAFSNCTALEEILFNAVLVENMGNYAFNKAGINASGITVTVGNQVTEIPACLFSPSNVTNSPKIVRVEFEAGSSCTTIGDQAFLNCVYLSSIHLPESITSIGTYAFNGCTALTGITISKHVTSIGYFAFGDCTALAEIHFNATNVSDGNNHIFNNAGNDGSGITVTIGNSVSKIPAYLFSASTTPKITRVAFEENSICTGIGNQAFAGCTNLSSITLPDSLTSIGSYAFESCSALESITIPEHVTFIDNNAFCNCTALAEIHFNAINMDDVADGSYVFDKAGTNSSGITLTIGEQVTKIPSYLFWPSSSSTVPNITEVVFAGESRCESIGMFAFGQGKFSSITLPRSVLLIDSYAFYGCTALETLYYSGSTSQWAAITKKSGWDYMCQYTLVCHSGS